jgi:methanogenic corrinoid protein MtbC1
MIQSRKHQLNFVLQNLEALKEAIRTILPENLSDKLIPVLDAGENIILDENETSLSKFEYGEPFDMEAADAYVTAITTGKKVEALNIIQGLIDKGESIPKIYEKIIVPSQYEVGRLWEMNKISVAQEHLATNISQFIMSHFFFNLLQTKQESEKEKKILGVCVGPELHENRLTNAYGFIRNEWMGYHICGCKYTD